MEDWWDFKKTYRLGNTFDEALAEYTRVTTRNSKSPDIAAHRLLSVADIQHHAQPAVLEGVYFLLNQGEVVYVGRSDHIFDRIATHVVLGRIEFDSYHWVPATGLYQARLEQVYIGQLSPKYNIRHVREVV